MTTAADSGGALRVLCAGALRAQLERLAERFQIDSGLPVQVVAGTAGEIRQLAAAGPAALVIVTAEVVTELIQARVLAPETQLPLARVGVGVAALPGASPLELAAPADLRRVLLSARSLSYADPSRGATAGQHMAVVIERLGIRELMRDKTVLRGSGAAACAAVAVGEAELVATQISEILAEPRVALLAALPRELQRVTVYTGALTIRGCQLEPARAFFAQLATAARGAEFAAAGLDYRD